jgi:hypothetical protein
VRWKRLLIGLAILTLPNLAACGSSDSSNNQARDRQLHEQERVVRKVAGPEAKNAHCESERKGKVTQYRCKVTYASGKCKEWAIAIGSDDEGGYYETNRGCDPNLLKACGSIDHKGRSLAVDIVEGHYPLSCAAAQGVMRRFLAQRHGRVTADFRYRRINFGCYKSRQDGVGWDYHCSPASYKHYVDVGAGRRF